MKQDRQAIQSMLTSIKNNRARGIYGVEEQIDKLEKYIENVRGEEPNEVHSHWKGMLGKIQ